VELLIEREAELAGLGEVVDAAVDGRGGGAALIEGEPGIGKTHLLGAVRDHASVSEARVLYATAEEIETSVPLAAARVLLGRAARRVSPDGPARLGLLALAGALSEPTGPGSRTEEVVHALWWLIVELADERPLVLLLDDAQWTDDLTLGLLRMAARRAAQVPLALIVAARRAAPGSRHAALCAEHAFMRIEPPGLSIAGTAQLFEAVLGRPGSAAGVARAHAITRGNPLYLFELLQQARTLGLDPLSDVFVDGRPPPQLVRLVEDRLKRLTPAANALAHAVAVLGSDADARRARALADLEGGDAIRAEQELRSERVLDTDQHAFTHPLVAAAAREGIAAVDAAELHARAAELLAADGIDDQRLAEHLMYATPRGDASAVATLRRAAEAARRLGSLQTATRLLKRALAEPPVPGAVDAVEFELGRAQVDAGTEDGVRVLARLAEHAPEVILRTDAARHLARRLAQDGRGTEAVAVLSTVLRTLHNAHRELRLELLVELAFIATYSDLGLHDEAKRMIDVEAGRVTGRTPAEQLVMLGAQILRGDPSSDPAGFAGTALKLRLHRDYPGGFAVGAFTFAAATVQINADVLDDAERAMDVLRADAEELAVPYLIAVALRQQGLIAYLRGDLARCELEVRSAREAAGEFANRLTTPWLVMALAEQARLQEAEQLLASAGMLGYLPPRVLLTAALGSRGCLRLAQGDAQRAVEDLTEARDRCAAFFREQIEPPWRPRLLEALVLADRRDDAADVADEYARLAEGWGTPRARGHAARMRSLVAPRDRAISLLEDARTHFTASHARLELARCLTELGAHRRASGERRAARAILRDAHDTAHACRATALCDRAQAELLLAGGRPRPPAGTGVNALTPAERRVAEIAADGATNRDIARRLYLSPKTVEMHLHSAYRKLDLPGRAGLATALH
jgi:DNA-binding CsgD family transcriptional regulator